MARIQSGRILSLTMSGLMLAAIPMLSACSMETPTALSQKKVEVLEKSFHSEIETAAVDDAVMERISSSYKDSGRGVVAVMVTYNPAGHDGNTAMKATENAARIARGLGRHGIGQVETEVMPVVDSEKSFTHFNYSGYVAQAPEDCDVFEDIDDSVKESYRDYRLGCTTEAYVARQIARPADLLGQGGMDDADGRRLGNVIAGGQRSGEPNEPLEGELASDN